VSRQASYPYASGNLLEQRNTYFYTTYRGAAFLEAWRRQRAEALSESTATLPAATPAEDSAPHGVRPTDFLLESVAQHLSAKDCPPENIALLGRLLQRFEVSKRLHGEYDARWRPVDPSDYRSLERYIRFAEILDLAYQQTGALIYLNALLKIVDTLTSLRMELSAQQRTRLRRVIGHEREHVEQLAAGIEGKINAA
jgi:methionyl-tRNA formyltransferase